MIVSSYGVKCHIRLKMGSDVVDASQLVVHSKMANEAEYWRQATSQRSIVQYKTYFDNFPNGAHIAEAEKQNKKHQKSCNANRKT